MTVAKKGDTVRVHYAGRLKDGSVFQSSEGRSPVEFTLGKGEVITGLEEAVEGLAVGEQIAIRIPPEKAYGHQDEGAVIGIPRQRFPTDGDPAVGDRYRMKTADGQTVEVTVSEVGNELVTVDANHPLAGRALSFDVRLMEIV